MFGTKKDYFKLFNKHYENKSYSKADAIARKAFANKKSDEGTLASIAGSIYELKLTSSFDLLEEFVYMFPNSLHAIRPQLSDLLARSGSYDDATEEARIYLRLIYNNSMLNKLSEDSIIQYGVSKAFLLVTSSYTELGSRSYSKAILTMALEYDLTEKSKNWILYEIKRLNEELLDAKNFKLDTLWSNFFDGGANTTALYEHCNNSGFPRMAKRVDLIESNFRYNSDYSISAESVFDLVTEYDDAFVLI